MALLMAWQEHSRFHGQVRDVVGHYCKALFDLSLYQSDQ